MSTPLLHPTLDAALAIHAELLSTHGGTPGLKAPALLEAALAAPQAALLGATAISDPVEMAAAYLFHIGRNDAFTHASKSAALATCLVFLSENGLLQNEDLDASAWESLTLDTAACALSREEVAQRLRHLVS
jgi:death-on-curing protein